MDRKEEVSTFRMHRQEVARLIQTPGLRSDKEVCAFMGIYEAFLEGTLVTDESALAIRQFTKDLAEHGLEEMNRRLFQEIPSHLHPRLGWRTLAHLVRMTRGELLGQKGLGEATEVYVVRALAKFGLRLGMEAQELSIIGIAAPNE